MENKPDEILDQDIHLLNFSQSLTLMLELNQVGTLKQLLERPMDEWFGFTSFSQHLLHELMNHLDHHRLLPLVKDEV